MAASHPDRGRSGFVLALWSPKGGSGTSVLAAACAVVAARAGDVRLADLDGDQPAIFGLGADPLQGLNDWLAMGDDAPPDALDRLGLSVAPSVGLVPRGAERTMAPISEARAGAALVQALRARSRVSIVDAGRAATPAARAVVELADAAVVVVRGCYLGLRRSVHSPMASRAVGIAFVDEPGRSLGSGEVADVLDRPVLTRVPVRASIARAVDAGVLASRLPDGLGRAAERLLDRTGAAWPGAQQLRDVG